MSGHRKFSELSATMCSPGRVRPSGSNAPALRRPSTARLVTNSFSRMIWLAAGLGLATGFVGMNLSYHLDVQSGPTIVLVAAAIFAATFAVTGLRQRGRPRRF